VLLTGPILLLLLPLLTALTAAMMTKNAEERERQKGIISINNLMAGVKVLSKNTSTSTATHMRTIATLPCTSTAIPTLCICLL
jgi:hypothetical protein